MRLILFHRRVVRDIDITFEIKLLTEVTFVSMMLFIHNSKTCVDQIISIYYFIFD